MSNSYGKNFRISIFGESHGAAIGMVIDGLPPGLEIDLNAVNKDMKRRSAALKPQATGRREADRPEIISGLYNNKTTGTPLCLILRNLAKNSHEYNDIINGLLRPGHSDYSGFVHYKGFNDPRGGGHFSGRLTAPLVFAGALARQLLAAKGITVGAHIAEIGGIRDDEFTVCGYRTEVLETLRNAAWPVLNGSCGTKMKEQIAAARGRGDSLGGIVEAVALNLPAGIGEPFFDGLESTISALLFSIPAVKGVEFGSGFAFAQMRGSQANDAYSLVNGNIITKTNHNGGINGGISNGMPLVCRVAIKPTPSIALEQQTVNLKTMQEDRIRISGRHDACIVPRALPVIEAAVMIALLDAIWEGDKK